MNRIRWTEKSIPFQALVDNPAITKPALVQIGTKLVIVGEKIAGQFITAAPCRVSNDRFIPKDQELVLSSKHPGVWQILSKTTSKKDGHIQRLTTKDIEKLFEKDVKNDRQTPRTYICTKTIEVFEFLPRTKDASIDGGYRIERRRLNIEENTEFEIRETGETEYTPREGERTTQDYVTEYRKTSMPLLKIMIPGFRDEVKLIRNRVLRSLTCVTKNEAHRRHFFIEVNENPCEIRPIASDGSSELRYLQSTQNLFNYMLNYGNDSALYVKVFRGDPPVKAVECGGHMVFRSILNGDQVPICRVDNMEVSLVTPDLSVRVKLPASDSGWRSLPEIVAAERQCMQLPLSLLARHESETYVNVEGDRNIASHLQSSNDYGHQPSMSRTSSSTIRKPTEGRENSYGDQLAISQAQYTKDLDQSKLMRVASYDESKTPKVPTYNGQSTRQSSYPTSERPVRYEEKPIRYEEKPVRYEEKPIRYEEKPVRYEEKPIRYEEKPIRYEERPLRFDEKRTVSAHVKSEVPRYEQPEKRHHSQRISTKQTPRLSANTSSSSSSRNQTTRMFVP